jgi:stage II sporulation protein AB (anti-sigma F factor)
MVENNNKELINSFKLEFLSRAENVGLSRITVAAFASQLDLTLNDLEEIKVAVSEAVSNSIIHGYKENPDGIVRVAAFLYPGTLEISVEDFGCGIDDVAQALEPTYSTNPERMGLGFTFMNSFMDELQVTSEVDKGTTVRMVKRVSEGDS